MKKRLLSLVLVTAMVSGLVACNKKAENVETTTAETTTAAIEQLKQTGTVADYSAYVTLGQYTGLEIAVDSAVITDNEIKEYEDGIVDYMNQNYPRYEEITEGVTAVGDLINLDFSGLLDGEAFANGTAEGATYTIGGSETSKFIDDLDTQLAGLTVGQEYDLPCTFPAEYSNADLAGKDVIFRVTVNYICGEQNLYTWNDELANVYSDGAYTTAAALEEALIAQLTAENESNQETEYHQNLWNTILENCTFGELPEEKIQTSADAYYQSYVDYYTYYASMFGMEYADFLAQYGMSEEELKEDCRTSAEQETKFIIVACEIAKAINYTLTDEVFSEKAAAIASEYGYDSAAAFVEDNDEAYVREVFIYDEISSYLYENNKMVITE